MMAGVDIDTTLSALADGTRRAILDRLSAGPANISELAGPFEMSLAGISKHVRILERAGLVSRQRVWREQRISIERGTLDAAARWFEDKRRFWAGRLDALDDAIANEQSDQSWEKQK
ncbi:ArsR/SmtB family transcription factor [Hyphobacterium indicum]|uniref:ArsR/SmtB family transcription factor n=1 Tax=Hyphobacterium indicum TaxID=2162714 RepID=UPI001F2F14BD|nr:metalloregulator ArsR/SmtB family transcription factor [Hyphobacterium indicum]